MRTVLRKVGNSRGVLIPAAFLAECGVGSEIEMRQEGRAIVIEPVKTGAGIGSGFQADKLGRQGNAIAYTYDSEGRRTGEEVHDPQNALTRYAGDGYDDNGRLHKLTLPGDAKESAKYDLVGNIVGTKKTGVKFL